MLSALERVRLHTGGHTQGKRTLTVCIYEPTAKAPAPGPHVLSSRRAACLL